MGRVLLAFVFGVSLVVAGFAGVTKLPQMMAQRRLDRRLTELSASPDAAPSDENDGLIKQLNRGTLPVLDEDEYSVAHWLASGC